MIALRVKFDLGRYHATPWGVHVNDEGVEWPPSPLRILRAIYAVSRTNTELAPVSPEIEKALELIARVDPPSYFLPPAKGGHTRHFMPLAGEAKTSMILDNFLALAPDSELVVFWDVDLPTDLHRAFAAAANSLSYLGRSESVCSARLSDPEGAPTPNARPKVDGVGGGGSSISLFVPSPEDPLATITQGVSDLKKKRAGQPKGSRAVEYLVEPKEKDDREPDQPAFSRPTLALFQIYSSPLPVLSEAVAVGQLLRGALQSRYGKENGKESSATFSGKSGGTPRKDQHLHSHYLSLPAPDGHRVSHMAVWAPEGLGTAEVATIAGLRSLYQRPGSDRSIAYDLGLVSLGLESDIRRSDLLGPSRNWKSVTPFGMTRHPKRRGGKMVDTVEDQVAREISFRASLPPVETVVITDHRDWHRFRTSRTGTSLRTRVRPVGVRVTFPYEVSGPIALGALSHFGLGLMRPA